MCGAVDSEGQAGKDARAGRREGSPEFACALARGVARRPGADDGDGLAGEAAQTSGDPQSAETHGVGMPAPEGEDFLAECEARPL